MMRTGRPADRVQLLLLLAQLVLMLSRPGEACPRPCSCQQPGEVHCTFRSLMAIPAGIPRQVERMNLGFNSISRITDSSLVGLRKLDLLMMHGNDIHNIPDGAFRDLSSLQMLKLSYNKLRELRRGTLRGLWSLTRLHLDHNRLETLHPDAFQGLTGLRLLQLEGNRLQQLHPHALCTFSLLGHFPFSSLRHLHLADNALRGVSRELLRGAPLLETLTLHGNPWSCDCGMRWFRAWNQRASGVLKCKKDRAYEGGQLCPLCSSPTSLRQKELQQLDDLTCSAPVIISAQRSSMPEDTDSEVTPPEEFRPALGNVSLGLTDEHGNKVNLECSVREMDGSTRVSWAQLGPGSSSISANVSFSVDLECPMDRGNYERLWRLIAYYSDVPAHLQREVMLEKEPNLSYRYRQDPERDALYFTGVRASVKARPSWVMQPEMDLQLNRRQSSGKLVRLLLSARTTQHLEPKEARDQNRAWVLIQNHNRTRTAVTTVVGQSVVLECIVTSSGDPAVEWVLPDGSRVAAPHRGADGRLAVSESGELSLRAVEHGDAGLYYCVAHVTGDFSVLPFRLVVEESSSPPPGGEGVTAPASGFAADRVLLPCEASGSPDAERHWILPDGHVVSPHSNATPRALLAANGSLVLPHGQISDNGYYKCVALSAHGVDTLATKLTLSRRQGRPVQRPPVRPQGAKGVSTRVRPKPPQEQTEKREEEEEVEGPSGEEGVQEEVDLSARRGGEAPSPRRRMMQGGVRGGGGHPSRNSWRRPGMQRKPIRPGSHGAERGSVEPPSQPRRRVGLSNNQIDPKRWANILAKVRDRTKGTTPSPPLTTTEPPLTYEATATMTPEPVFITELPDEQEEEEEESDTDTTPQSEPPMTDSPLDYPEEDQFEETTTRDPITESPMDLSTLYIEVQTSEQTTEPPLDLHDPEEEHPDFTTEPPLDLHNPEEENSELTTEPPLDLHDPEEENPDFTTEPPLDLHNPEEENSELTTEPPLDLHDPEEENSELTTEPPLDLHNPEEENSELTTEPPLDLHNPEEENSELTTEPPLDLHDPEEENPDSTTEPPLDIRSLYAEEQTHVIYQISEPDTDTDLFTESINTLEATDSTLVISTSSTDAAEDLPSIEGRLGVSSTDKGVRSEHDQGERPLPRGQGERNFEGEMTPPQLPRTPPTATSFAVKPYTRLATHPATSHTTTPTPTPSTTLLSSSTLGSITPSSDSDPSSSGSDPSPQGRGSRRRGGGGKRKRPGRVRNRPNVSQAPELVRSHAQPITPASSSSSSSSPLAGPTVASKPRIETSGWAKSAAASPGSAIPLTEGQAPSSGRVSHRHNTDSLSNAGKDPASGRDMAEKSSASKPDKEERDKAEKSSASKPDKEERDMAAKSSVSKPDKEGRDMAEKSSASKPDKEERDKAEKSSASKPDKEGRDKAAKSSASKPDKEGRDKAAKSSASKPDKEGRYPTAQSPVSQPELEGKGRDPVAQSPASQPAQEGEGRTTHVSTTASRASQDTSSRAASTERLSPLSPESSSPSESSRQKGVTSFHSPAENPLEKTHRTLDKSSKSSHTHIQPPLTHLQTSHTHRETNHTAIQPQPQTHHFHHHYCCYAQGKATCAHIPRHVQHKSKRPDSSPARRTTPVPPTTHVPPTRLVPPPKIPPSGGTAARPQSPDASQPSPAVPTTHGKPRISSTGVSTLTVPAEADAHLPCVSSGEPRPFLSWTKVSTGASVAQNTRIQRFEVHSNGTLIIRKTLPSDRGQYMCSVQNQYGEDRAVVSLVVLSEHPRVVNPKYRDTTVHMGESVDLECQAKGHPTPRVTWVLPDRGMVHTGALSSAGSNFQRVALFPNGTLRITQSIYTDRGIYKCIASNAAGADSVTVRLHVSALPPTILQGRHDNISLPEGSSAYLHCSAQGTPPPTVRWTSPDNTQLRPSQFVSGRNLFVFPNGTLFVRSLGQADSGRYECAATNTIGAAWRAISLAVIPATASLRSHITFSSPQNTQVGYGAQLRLDCIAAGNPEPRIIWRTPSKKLVDTQYSYDPRLNVFPNGTLVLQPMTEKDEGDYLCVARNKMGDDYILLRVAVVTKPAKIMQKSSLSQEVTYGSDLRVDCVALGLPNPKIQWALPDGTMINSIMTFNPSASGPGRSRRYVVFDNGTLFFNDVGMREEGDYTCYADNQVGKDEMKVRVKVVSDAPIIRNQTQGPVRVLYGESASLRCEAKGEPIPTILWFSPASRTIPTSSDKYRIHSDGTLVIQKVQRLDGGNYTCLARNSAGQARQVTRLEILVSPPTINGLRGGATSALVRGVTDQRKLLDCVATGMPVPRITWVLPNNVILPAPYYGSRMTVHRNGTLEIRGLKRSDAAQLACVAQNEGGEARLQVLLEVQDPEERPPPPPPPQQRPALPSTPLQIPKTDTRPLTIGAPILLNCSLAGSPPAPLTWVLPNGSPLASGARYSRFYHRPDGMLLISNPTLSESGVYRCVGRSAVTGTLVERSVALVPERPPEISSRYSAPISVLVGASLQLHCQARQGAAPVRLSWKLPTGVVLTQSQRAGRYNVLPNGTLSISQASVHDRGSYVCHVANEYGSATLTVPVIIITYAPRITSGPTLTTQARRGVAVQLNCAATGLPRPEIAWETPDRTRLVVSPQPRLFGNKYLHPQGALIIQNPSPSDSGFYRCTARNVIGIDSKGTYLRVL
ncbi:matrix-remodeling-associated protein 5 [Alosa pseudoharengus]|uniref:matrix-remodeling-associated protein 5 n=1 Tax=Alosa pseudoharengus TaxID=34774 RepID=UPI003F8927E0